MPKSRGRAPVSLAFIIITHISLFIMFVLLLSSFYIRLCMGVVVLYTVCYNLLAGLPRNFDRTYFGQRPQKNGNEQQQPKILIWLHWIPLCTVISVINSSQETSWLFSIDARLEFQVITCRITSYNLKQKEIR